MDDFPTKVVTLISHGDTVIDNPEIEGAIATSIKVITAVIAIGAVASVVKTDAMDGMSNFVRAIKGQDPKPKK